MAEYTLAKNFNTTAVFTVDADNPIEASQKFQEIIDKISNEIFDDEYKVDGKCDFYGQEITKVTEFLSYDFNEEDSLIYDDCFNVFDLSGIEKPKTSYDDSDSIFNEKDINSIIETDEVKFIWGLKAKEDLTNTNVGLFTLNNIDIVYNFKEQQYYLGVEEFFDNDKGNRISYYESLCDDFKKYLLSLGFTEDRLAQTNKCSIFKIPISTTIIGNLVPLKSRTLLDLYYKFVWFIKVLKVIL